MPDGTGSIFPPQVAALKGALIALSEGRSGSAPVGADGAAGPDHGLTITRGRELAARVSELSTALEVGMLVGGRRKATGGGVVTFQSHFTRLCRRTVGHVSHGGMKHCFVVYRIDCRRPMVLALLYFCQVSVKKSTVDIGNPR